MREVAPGLGWYEYGGDVGAVALAFPAGFHAEGAGRPGLAHFAEHMLMAPRDRQAHPYARLEERGCLLEARTRRDHLTVTVSGPQRHLLRAVETLVAHLTDLERPGDTALRQAEIIRNEVLEKTALSPATDRWRWCVPTPDGAIGADHDPVVAPALAGSAVHADAWQAFLARHVRLDRCSAAVAADPALVGPGAVESALGPRTVPRIPRAASPGRGAQGCKAPRDEIVLPVRADDLAGQSAALAAAELAAETVAAAHRQPGAAVHYGLFDEWFSENAPTVVTVPLPAGTDGTAVEERMRAFPKTVTEPGALARARRRLSHEWARRLATPSACARLTAWMLLGGRMGDPFAPCDPDLVEHSASAAAVLRGA
ncbi:hypothetical protein GTU99_11775 [Streptomyces sp. PRKS01-65]|nr:insulinase family protein [Streptomyces harenosi]NEY32864.1 hypothetical protein [Streptomyces harenosi]